MDTKIFIPSDIEKFYKLKVGQKVLINGVIYTARDQAHKRITENINKKGLKRKVRNCFDFKNQVIYYTGAT
ncbi:fumarate hydratase C-terminal domain-containing protein, partial [bacterium]|nr:fumarate hydratase C-terminal domain-containing protein [bacterium]